MKTIKYLPLARAIKAVLQLGIVYAGIMTLINLTIAVFDLNPYVNIWGGTLELENPKDGYKLGANINLRIPDTLIHYQDGDRHVDKNEPLDIKSQHEQRIVKEKMVNQIRVYEDNGIDISNDILIPGTATVKVNSKNWGYNLFWGISSQLNLLFGILLSLILIKLTNRYMDQEIFEKRTFKLIGVLGWLFIIKEIFNFVISFINGKILEHPQLHSFSALGAKAYSYLTLDLDFYKAFSLGNVGVGILIIILAEVFKDAILAKKENEMTI